MANNSGKDTQKNTKAKDYYDMARALLDSSIPEDSERAFQYFVIAAERGYVPSYNAVGLSYLTGRGVSKDLHKALVFFHKGAELGSVKCTYEEAKILAYGPDDIRNPTVAADMLMQLGPNKSAKTNELLIDLFLSPTSVIRNVEVGMTILVKGYLDGYEYLDRIKEELSNWSLSEDVTNSFIEQVDGWIHPHINSGNITRPLNLLNTLNDYLVGSAALSFALAMLISTTSGWTQRSIDLLRQSATRGHHYAMHILADLLFEGVPPLSKDTRRAFALYRKLNDIAPNPRVRYSLAMCYLTGEGTKKDEERAIKLLKYAAAVGHIGANIALAKYYLERSDTKDSYAREAIKLLNRIADKDSTAQGILGLCYMHGIGVYQSREVGIRFLTKSALSGSISSMKELVDIYENSAYDEQLYKKYLTLYAKASSQEGVSALTHAIIRRNYKEEDITFQTLLELAKEGNLFAKCSCALIYEKGYSKYDKAAELFEQAIDGGCIEAYSLYAFFLFNKDSGYYDPSRAQKMLLTAIAEGDTDAEVLYAEMMTHKSFEYYNPKEAVAIFRKLKTGKLEARCLNNLAELYFKGEGVAYDVTTAVRLLKEAYEAGDETAILTLADHYIKLEEYEEAEKVLLEYKSRDELRHGFALNVLYLSGVFGSTKQKRSYQSLVDRARKGSTLAAETVRVYLDSKPRKSAAQKEVLSEMEDIINAVKEED